jgi:ketosteroid isomerase-like protein
MKSIFFLVFFNLMATIGLYAQDSQISKQQKQDINVLIKKYSQARESKDTMLLESILTNDVDQLVSSGKRRIGKKECMDGMLRSSTSNPGKRSIKVEKIRLFNAVCGIVDARYEIQNADGTTRKMWSTFMVVYTGGNWKISAVRNMLPAG